MLKTTQSEFHVMRGHIEEGTEIECINGDVLTIRATMSGWQLVNQDGAAVGKPTHSAYLLAKYIYDY